MTLKLYKLDLSPPARAAMMTCDYLGLLVEMIDVNIMEGKQLEPEYIKKNPVHTIPVLEDGDLTVTDSHAILMYLADAYSKDDTLYPKDVKSRTLVNQKLFFDSAILFPRIHEVTYPAIMKGETTIKDYHMQDLAEVYHFMEQFLSKSKYVAGDNMTIADISIYADMTCLTYLLPLDECKYPKTKMWMDEMESKPFAKTKNAPGAAILGKLINDSIGELLKHFHHT